MKGEGEGRLRLSIAKQRFSHVISSHPPLHVQPFLLIQSLSPKDIVGSDTKVKKMCKLHHIYPSILTHTTHTPLRQLHT